MYSLVILLPFLSFLQSFIFGFYFGRFYVSWISLILLGLSFIISCFIFYEVAFCNSATSINLYNWITLGVYQVKFGLYFDALTAAMLIIITAISFFVHTYSVEYMSHDPFLNRFLAYLSLFTFFMILLVTSNNFVQLFIGWEGVGLCSYLLINFWFTRILANKAALKAMIMNRIADVFFILGIFIIFLNFGTADYLIVFNLLSSQLPSHDLICIFLFLGAIGKSAQIGFHTWLPDAMEGPTPVSSLLHAATMVTAGVFLILRCSPIFEQSAEILSLIAVFGGLTAFFSAFVAVFQWDIKKVIAYSTCSQLGYMFLACGLSFYSVALFHLFNHAFFKALLFLSAGSVIHSLQDEQDMRKMGGLIKFLPFTFICFMFGSLAIMGLPFLTGFYSKDLILELIVNSYEINAIFFYSLAITAAFLTSIYSIRLIIFVFFLPANFYYVNHPEEPGWFITFTLSVLVFLSIVTGFLFSDMFVGYGAYFLSFSLQTLPNNNSYINLIILSPFIKNLPLIFTILGAAVSALSLNFWHYGKDKLNYVSLSFFNQCASFFFNAGFFNIIYNNAFIYVYKLSYAKQTKLIDKGMLEAFGPIGLYRFTKKISHDLRNLPYFIFLNIGLFFFSISVIYLLSLPAIAGVSFLSDYAIMTPFIMIFAYIEIFYAAK